MTNNIVLNFLNYPNLSDCVMLIKIEIGMYLNLPFNGPRAIKVILLYCLRSSSELDFLEGSFIFVNFESVNENYHFTSSAWKPLFVYY